MEKYRVETHSHTQDVSPCSHTPAALYAQLFAQHGYDTVFLTNHLCKHVFDVHHIGSWDEGINFFFDGFAAAKREVNGRFILIPAVEICFLANYNDYLVYGVTPEFLLGLPELFDMKIEDFYPIAKQAGLTVIQAHPFRKHMTVVNPDFLDGYETENANPRHNSNNDIARLWADKYGKLRTQGTDYHEPGDIGLGGMYFDSPVNCTADFIRQLK